MLTFRDHHPGIQIKIFIQNSAKQEERPAAVPKNNNKGPQFQTLAALEKTAVPKNNNKGPQFQALAALEKTAVPKNNNKGPQFQALVTFSF